MQVGKLRHPVTIERPVSSVDGAGAAVRGWETYLTRWAAVEPLSGSEPYSGDQVRPEATYTVRIRGEGVTLTTDHRIRWNNRVLEIESIANPDSVSRELVIGCREATQKAN